MTLPGPALRAAALAALVIAAGCGKKDDARSPTSPTPATPAGPVHYTAIGASDAIGIGASRICITLAPCPEGTGYVPIIARQLAATRPVTLSNLGIPGAVLGPETQSLARRYGRDIPANFLVHEVPLVPRETTLVTVFAGGNDVNAIGTAIDRGAAGGDVGGFIDQEIRQFANDLELLIRGVRNISPSARIVVANLPNLSRLPYAAGLSASGRDVLRRLAVGFSTQAINPFVGQGVTVVDLLCDSRAYDPAHLSSDGFHPNDRGYQVMADALLAGINSASPTPPRARCPEMD